MMARGFTGEMRAYSRHHMTGRDWAAVAGAVIVAVAAVLAGPHLP